MNELQEDNCDRNMIKCTLVFALEGYLHGMLHFISRDVNNV